MNNVSKYEKKYDWKKSSKRSWIDNEIKKAPNWCSVDLRDGNQALPSPMSMKEKIEFFEMLVKIGFKDIEVGFPAASSVEYDFLRYLIDNNKIPDDVRIQVLTQARPQIIEKTFEAVEGAKNVIMHVYNSISKAQREQVFKKSKDDVKKIAINGAIMVRDEAKKYSDINWTFEYSPESFTGCEMDYAVEVIDAVTEIWSGETENKIIINLPATMEFSRPNIFADQIEYVCENIKRREEIEISIHPHNDRGTAVASSELGILAGADRVEGTLFGNGERTGNVDIVTLALNMYIEGIDPKLDFSRIEEIKNVFERVTKMNISSRHPYAGELVFTAFSGSHQDAISKSERYAIDNNISVWDNPYIMIDPIDVGRKYEPIKINSQSGSGGIKYIIESKSDEKISDEDRNLIMIRCKEASIKKGGVLTDEEIMDEYSKYIKGKISK